MPDEKIPKPAIVRLCSLYKIIQGLETNGETTASSSLLAKKMGLQPHTVRKDISYIGEGGSRGAGYSLVDLKRLIENSLGFGNGHPTCLVGLGRLGSAMLKHGRFFDEGYKLVAGFDTNVNKLEILETDVPLYPAYMIPDIIAEKRIEFAVLAVPEEAVQAAAERLISGGIKGIVNFAPVEINHGDKDVFIRNISVLGELRVLTAYQSISKQ